MKLVFFLFEFFKIGSFTYGGGLAMIPILRDIAVRNAWLTEHQFADLIAISQSTPGPIAINMATYIGYAQHGVLGAILASLTVVFPAFLMAILLGNFLKKYNKHPYVQAAFIGLKAVVVGLIGTAIIQVSLVSIYGKSQGRLNQIMEGIDIKSVLFLGVSYVIIKYTQKHPIVYIVVGGILGMFIWA